MNTALIIITVVAFGLIAYFLDRLPTAINATIKMAISFPALIYFTSVALGQTADQKWGTWLFAIVALGIFVRAVRDFRRVRNGSDMLDHSH